MVQFFLAHPVYYSNLSDQSALETGLGLGLDSELHYFSIFHE